MRCAAVFRKCFIDREFRPPYIFRERRSVRVQIEMTVRGLVPDPITNMPVIVLRERGGERVLPIWVGFFEGTAIELQIDNVQTPRPMTHDLLTNVIAELGAKVERVVVSGLKENTFYALLHVSSKTGPIIIDARPSDAIALALRTGSQIFVEEDVISNARSVESAQENVDVGRLQKWLESLSDEDLGKYKM